MDAINKPRMLGNSKKYLFVPESIKNATVIEYENEKIREEYKIMFDNEIELALSVIGDADFKNQENDSIV